MMHLHFEASKTSWKALSYVSALLVTGSRMGSQGANEPVRACTGKENRDKR